MPKVSLYPKRTLMDSLKIAESIQSKNAGKPYARLDLAEAMKTTPSSSGFRNLITASGLFGLTTGSYNATKIALTPLGKSIVAPRSEEEKQEGLRKSLLSIDLFNRFYTRFNGNKLPAINFLKNTLETDFGVPSEDTERCYDLLVLNAEQLGIIHDISGSKHIRLDRLGSGQTQPQSEEEIQDEGHMSNDTTQIAELVSRKDPSTPPKVFISHGKNVQIVEVVKELLELSGYEPIVAMEEETLAIPISDKVIESMRQCEYGIMNISLDERELRDDEKYGVNQNVLIEIGAAVVLYNKKVILLADKRVDIPSNLKDLYQCRYEGEQLDGPTTIKLLKTIRMFREE